MKKILQVTLAENSKLECLIEVQGYVCLAYIYIKFEILIRIIHNIFCEYTFEKFSLLDH